MGAGASVAASRVTKAQAMDICGDRFSLATWDTITKDADGTISKEAFQKAIKTDPSEVAERVRSAFAACDTDSTGKLSMAELIVIFGEESAKWYQEQMDGFGDGSDKISLTEWEGYFSYMEQSGKALESLEYVEGHIAAALAAKPAAALTGDIAERVRSAFAACDVDGGGKLSKQELIAIFGEEYAKWYQEQMDGIGESSDKVVSLAEWEGYFAYMHQMGKAEEALAYVEGYITAAAAAKPATLEDGDIKTRVHAAFSACDTNNNGKLTMPELLAIFGEESAKWYQEQMDGFGDKSNTVSLGEWEAYFVYMQASGKVEEAVADVEAYIAAAAETAKPAGLEDGDIKTRVHAAFSACDSNNNGKLTMPELLAIFGEESAKWYQDQMDGFGDKSNTVTLSEWEAYFVYMQASGQVEEAVAGVEAYIAAAAEE